MQLLGGLLSVLPERVSKTMQAHKEVLLKRVSGRHWCWRQAWWLECFLARLSSLSAPAPVAHTCKNNSMADKALIPWLVLCLCLCCVHLPT